MDLVGAFLQVASFHSEVPHRCAAAERILSARASSSVFPDATLVDRRSRDVPCYLVAPTRWACVACASTCRSSRHWNVNGPADGRSSPCARTCASPPWTDIRSWWPSRLIDLRGLPQHSCSRRPTDVWRCRGLCCEEAAQEDVETQVPQTPQSQPPQEQEVIIRLPQIGRGVMTFPHHVEPSLAPRTR